jgi:peptidoglycan-associated lipoprotein
MQSRSFRSFALWSGLFALTILAGACAKKPVAPAPPPPAAPAPAPARPTVTLNASASFVHSGENLTLNWSSTNATDLVLEPSVGKVAPEGQTTVSPTESTTYTITATGPGGSADASVRVTVGPPPPPEQPKVQATLEELFKANVFDAFFDFNKSDVRADARDALSKTAEFLRQYPQVRVSIEGHCDERGSTEYNLGLGERRAQAAKNFLTSLGISADRMETVSWGKERPFCSEHTEDCWQKNRRAHFVMAH